MILMLLTELIECKMKKSIAKDIGNEHRQDK